MIGPGIIGYRNAADAARLGLSLRRGDLRRAMRDVRATR